MFSNRKNSQKPNEEFISKFQRTFSDVCPPGQQGDSVTFDEQSALGLITPSRLSMGSGDQKTNGGTASHNPQDFRFTPSSFVDPSSISFMPFANQHNGYYTPNSSELAAAFHSQAGDLHTPTMGLNLMTPLSLGQQQMSGAPLNPNNTAMDFDAFNRNFMPQQFQNPQSFAQQQSFAPSAFVHRNSYDTMDDLDTSSLQDVDMQGNLNSQQPVAADPQDMMDVQDADGEKFRFHVSLRAPTAMIKHRKEIPVSYLNKGQAYSVSVSDSTPPVMGAHPVRYRTFIRVSFQDEEQRLKPSSCWQLWKEGRGTNEAHQRGGKLQAVEYVDPMQGGNEDQKHRQIRVESASFDGFCVTWSPNFSTGRTECSIPVRFNFLSTDFSHSKGVKGIPVRLCAKTEIISPDPMDAGTMGPTSEVSYCKVKLFRDHGAERKLSNDVAHVRKTIDKLRQQIAQAEMGGGNFGKRKRGNGSVSLKSGSDHRPSKLSKLSKHKRTWSMDSSDVPERLSLEDDLHAKLAMIQEMFSSTRSVSILSLRGDEQDDPDLHPVQLSGGTPDIKNEGRRASSVWPPRPALDTTPVSTLSPTNSNVFNNNSPLLNADVQIPTTNSDSGYHGSLGNSRSSSRVSDITGEQMFSKQPVKVERLSQPSKMSTGYIEAVDIDPTYRPPSERPPKPIACFYIRFPRNEGQEESFYRAVYLTERTAGDLMQQISQKRSISPSRISRVLHIQQNGLKIMVDDDVVRELPDGQDMVAEISEVSIPDNGGEMRDDSTTPAVEVKLTY